jgi:hypothetical protein
MQGESANNQNRATYVGGAGQEAAGVRRKGKKHFLKSVHFPGPFLGSAQVFLKCELVYFDGLGRPPGIERGPKYVQVFGGTNPNVSNAFKSQVSLSLGNQQTRWKSEAPAGNGDTKSAMTVSIKQAEARNKTYETNTRPGHRGDFIGRRKSLCGRLFCGAQVCVGQAQGHQ